MVSRALWRIPAPVVAALIAACSSDSTPSSGGAAPPGGQDGDAAVTTAPLYAMMIQVYGTEDRTVYVSLSSSLDVTPNIQEAREFPGVANFAAVGGRLLISSGIEPKITEFTIGQDNSWTEGRSVSFAAYPLTDNANFYYQFIADANNAILPYEGTKRIHWDPTEMAIKGNLTDTTLTPSEGALVVEAGGNRNGVAYEGSVMQTLFYHDTDWFTYGSKSHVVSYDAGTFTEKAIIDVPCPGLSIATRDEQGNTFFSSWDIPSSTLKGTAPATCIAKFGPNSELVTTLDPRTWTGGRFVNNFRYVGNGKAFGNVLHHEALGVDSPTKLTDEQLSTLGGDGPHWKLWLFDLEANTGAEVQGIDLQISGGAQMATLDGRTFLFVPYEDYGKTRAYELSPDGKATPRFDSVGDIFKWIKVR